jgi:hypothetical protein
MSLLTHTEEPALKTWRLLVRAQVSSFRFELLQIAMWSAHPAVGNSLINDQTQ